jgi:pyruvate,water dikinase
VTAADACYIRWFRDITLDDVPLVGGKTASLGELHRELTGAGLRVPDGFAITADAYTAILDAGGVRDRIARLLHGIDGRDVATMAKAGATLMPPPPGS